MEFCDNVKQLLQAYFRDFYLERLDKPWQAFTGSWTRTVLARYFGKFAMKGTEGFLPSNSSPISTGKVYTDGQNSKLQGLHQSHVQFWLPHDCRCMKNL
jgi:hypothetical protein